MKKFSLIIIALLTILVCCKKTPEVNIKYVDVEREVLTIGQTTANIQCDYEYISTLKSAKLYYGINETTSYVEMRVVQSTLYAEISGLNGGTTYQYYYEFTNGFNSMQSEAKTFVTESVPVSLPTVITANITEITSDSAIGGGEVTNDGGSIVTARGICWSTSANPTINDYHTTDGTGIGAFTSSLTGLIPNTIYHVRAYAITSAGTVYGLDKTFTTLSGSGGDIPPGAINGMFTINEHGDKVYFSQGNLQYQASTNTWRFAEHQWNFVGNNHGGNVFENGVKCNNSLISQTYDGWIDLLGWGTSGWDNGNSYYHPWDFDNPDGSLYGPLGEYNLTEAYENADWGVYNSISNGGNTSNQWRTLTSEEWQYVFKDRATTSDIRYAKAIVNGACGIILFPDNWNENTYSIDGANMSGVNYYINELSASQWTILEDAGAVFLPSGGVRQGTSVDVTSLGGYWSSSYAGIHDACNVFFSDSILYPVAGNSRFIGYCVRLVQDTNK